MVVFSRGCLLDSSATPDRGERVELLARVGGAVVDQILGGELDEPVEFDQDCDEWVVVWRGSLNLTATPMRERIVEVALDLFSRQGYGGTSLRHIAERVGVTKAAIYYHFHTKEDIARVVVTRAVDAIAT